MIFRVATLEDLFRLEQFEQAVVEAERPFNDALKAQQARYYDLPFLIADSQTYLLVVEHQATIIATGYVQIRTSKQSVLHEKYGYLGFMYVVPEHRGKGLNKAVIEHLIDWSKSKGICDFYLDVYSENVSAIKAYEKLGLRSSLVEMKLHL